jgi:DMSO/TMAO reductase YedYZ molybdopterin-dependent catalytic subunit
VTDKTTTRQVALAGAVAGVLGALVMVLAQAVARLGAGVPTFPDLFEDLATQIIPSVLFSHVLDALKFDAKPLLFVGLLLLQIVLGAVGGIVFGLSWGTVLDRHGRWKGWNEAVRDGVVLWLITAVILLPLSGHGLVGTATTSGPITLNLVLLVGFLLYTLTTAGGYRYLVATGLAPDAVSPGAEPADVASPERRRLLGGVATGAIAILTVGATYKILRPDKSLPAPSALPARPAQPALPAPAAVGPGVAVIPPQPAAVSAPGAGAPVVAAPASAASASAASAVTSAPLPTPSTSPEWNITGLLSEVTPTKDFYVVSKNFFSDPVVDVNRWVLEISGAVKEPIKMTYNQLLKLPAIERYETLECISNEVGGDLISNASWRGVSLRDLIASTTPDPATKKVVFTAADGYADSITFERGMSPENLLVYSMNGEPLLPGHGAPARLLIPGIYGMKNVKWLTKIELMPNDFQGYWQQRGWSDVATINPMSRIDLPTGKTVTYKDGVLQVAGIAFGGDQGISKIEVSLDDGKSWQEAKLKDPLDKYTWRLWHLETPATPGSHRLMVRATDGAGKLQVKDLSDTLPDGATGWHTVDIKL